METLSFSRDSVDEKKEDPADNHIDNNCATKRYANPTPCSDSEHTEKQEQQHQNLTEESKKKTTSMILSNDNSSHCDPDSNNEPDEIAARAREIMESLKERRETLLRTMRAGKPIVPRIVNTIEQQSATADSYSRADDSTKERLRSGERHTAATTIDRTSPSTTATLQPYSFISGRDTELMTTQMKKVLQERRERLNRILAGLDPDGREDDDPPRGENDKQSLTASGSKPRTTTEAGTNHYTYNNTITLRTGSATDARDAGSITSGSLGASDGVLSCMSTLPSTTPGYADSPFRKKSHNAAFVNTNEKPSKSLQSHPPSLSEIGEAFHTKTTEDTCNSEDAGSNRTDHQLSASSSSPTSTLDEVKEGEHTAAHAALCDQQPCGPAPLRRTIPIDTGNASSCHESDVRASGCHESDVRASPTGESPTARSEDRSCNCVSPVSLLPKAMESSLHDVQGSRVSSRVSSLGRVYSFEDTLATSAKEDPSIRMTFSFNSALFLDRSLASSSPMPPPPSPMMTTAGNRSMTTNSNIDAAIATATTAETRKTAKIAENQQDLRQDPLVSKLAFHAAKEPTLAVSQMLVFNTTSFDTRNIKPSHPLSSSVLSSSSNEDDPDDTCVIVSEASSFDCTADDTLSSGYLSTSITSERMTSLLGDDMTEMSINLLSSIKSFDSALEEEEEESKEAKDGKARCCLPQVDKECKGSSLVQGAEGIGGVVGDPSPTLKLESCLLRAINSPADSNTSKVSTKKVAFAETLPPCKSPVPPPQQLATKPEAEVEGNSDGVKIKTVTPRKPPLMFVSEEVADAVSRANGGLYSIAISTGLDLSRPLNTMSVDFKVQLRSSSGCNKKDNPTNINKNNKRFVMRLDPDFRCGAQGSMYNICVRSGCDLSKPWDWDQSSSNKRPYLPARGGLLDMALRSGLTPELLHSRAPMYIKTKPLSMCRHQGDAEVLPEDVSDYECGATGNLYLMFESAGGDYVSKGSLYYLATQSGMKLNQ